MEPTTLYLLASLAGQPASVATYRYPDRDTCEDVLRRAWADAPRYPPGRYKLLKGVCLPASTWPPEWVADPLIDGVPLNPRFSPNG